MDRLTIGALAVKRGAKLLDKVLPRWRAVMRKHEDEFDLSDPDYCVLGTLEHHSALKRRRPKQKIEEDDFGYFAAVRRLGIAHDVTDLGFEAGTNGMNDPTYNCGLTYQELDALWRAEFNG